MAHASRKHFGPGSQGKGDGTGAMTDLNPEDIPENIVLSNRDKSQHSDDRGLDSKAVQTGQFQDNSVSRTPSDDADDEE